MSIRTLFRSVSIKQRIFACIIIISLIPQLLLVTAFFQSSRDNLVQTTCNNIYQVLDVSNEILDEQLRFVKEASKNILIDDFLYAIFSASEDEEDVLNAALRGYYDNDRMEQSSSWNIKRTLYKYFGENQIVADVEIATHETCYPLSDQKTRYNAFWESDTYQELLSRSGGIMWLGKQDMAAYQVEEAYLSCMRLMNLRNVERTGIGTYMPPQYERPILRVLFSDEYIAEQLKRSIEGLDQAEYGLLGENGEMLLSGGTLNLKLSEDNLRQIEELHRGMLEVKGEKGENIVVCFDRMSQCGWTSIAAFSVRALFGTMDAQMRSMFVGIVVVQVITSLLAALLAARMMAGRIEKLNRAVDEVKEGHFTAKVVDDRQDEFTPLVHNFNEMSGTLRRLIDENIRVSLREQESRLQTLMTQLNPHYIYNSLNVINWVAMREGAKRSSALIVALSRMLRYTSNNREELTVLRDDLEWMRHYFEMMDARFGELYTVRWEVQEECLDLRLPKLFMQPLVENSILHGFGDRTQGGEICIRIWREGEDVLCEVADNGCGMDEQQAQDALYGRAKSIGIYNVHKRIEAACGEGYGLSIDARPGGGTRVKARMRIQ